MEIILFFLIVFGVLLVFAVGIYNRLIALRNRNISLSASAVNFFRVDYENFFNWANSLGSLDCLE